MNATSENPGYGSLLLTLLAGAAIGATVVALTTRKTGAERRADLKELAGQAQRRASDLAENAGLAWDDARSRTALAANDIKRGFTDAAADLRT